MMRRFPSDVTDTELAMLQVLWQNGRATRRQIADALYPGGDAAHYATVQKLMERLQDKGYVKHSRQRGVLVFTALVSRDELMNRRLREVADKLCGGALTPLVMNLVRSEPLTAGELDELQTFINEQRRRGKAKEKLS
jgi:BlaI family penicillinase repressor